MAQPDHQLWYILIDEKNVGPFSLEELFRLLDDGDIQPWQRASSRPSTGSWSTVADLRKSQADAQALSNSQGSLQQPDTDDSQRVEMTEPAAASAGTLGTSKSAGPSPETQSPVQVSNDTSQQLFSLLQMAKERRTARFTPPDQKNTARPEAPRLSLKKVTWIAAGIILVVVAGLWSRSDKDVQKNSTEALTQSAEPSRPAENGGARRLGDEVANSKKAATAGPGSTAKKPLPMKFQNTWVPPTPKKAPSRAANLSQPALPPHNGSQAGREEVRDERDPQQWENAQEPPQDGHPPSQPGQPAPAPDMIRDMAQDTGVAPRQDSQSEPPHSNEGVISE